ncbi:MAG: hypothetical protein KC456_00360 [Flavobacteriales bacterium]|nr:hypothetical protein [Flavobacteriales bacterium]
MEPLQVSKYLLTLLLLGSVTCAFAQKTFSGRLVYDITYDQVPEDMKGVENGLPEKCVVVTDGTSWWMEQHTEMNGAYSIVYQSQKDSIYEMLKVGPDRVRVSSKMELERRVWLPTENTQIWNGLSMLQYQSQDPVENPLTVWVSKEYAPILGLFYADLEGLPVRFTKERAGVRMTYALRRLKLEPIDETYFVLPSSYNEVSADLYQQWLR